MNVKQLASLGGKARWKGKSKKDRAAHAKMMVEMREKKKKSRAAS